MSDNILVAVFFKEINTGLDKQEGHYIYMNEVRWVFLGDSGHWVLLITIIHHESVTGGQSG